MLSSVPKIEVQYYPQPNCSGIPRAMAVNTAPETAANHQNDNLRLPLFSFRVEINAEIQRKSSWQCLYKASVNCAIIRNSAKTAFLGLYSLIYLGFIITGGILTANIVKEKET